MSFFNNIARAAMLTTIVGCTSAEPTVAELTPEEQAVCKAQEFLAANGYLEPLGNVDPATIQLEMWDRIQYQEEGVLDWTQLLADRQGRYSGRLFGAGAREGGYVVYYRLDAGYSCVTLSDDLSSVHLNEASCRVGEPLLRIRERNLQCRPSYGAGDGGGTLGSSVHYGYAVRGL